MAVVEFYTITKKYIQRNRSEKTSINKNTEEKTYSDMPMEIPTKYIKKKNKKKAIAIKNSEKI